VALWSTWVIGLIVLLLTHGLVLVAVAVVLMVVLVALARPMHARVVRAVPENAREGGAVSAALRGGTTRDRALRELTYGDRPMRAALEAIGASPRWVGLRHGVVALTLIAFIFVFIGPLV